MDSGVKQPVQWAALSVFLVFYGKLTMESVYGSVHSRTFPEILCLGTSRERDRGGTEI